MTRSAVFALTLGSLMSLSSLATGAPGTQANFLREEVLFTSNRHGHLQIYKKLPNGDEVRLAPSDSANLQPAWSRDGKIAFVSYRSGQGDIYVMDANGENLRQLTSQPGMEQQPAWSPDGRQLVFTAERKSGIHLFVINADGSGERNITPGYAEAGTPAWSPDGRQIAFVANDDGKMRLMVWNADDNRSRLVTSTALANERDPVWSPDSKTLAFTLNGKNSEGVNLASVDVASGEVRRLTRNMYINSNAVWSPDGSKIGYLSNADTQGSFMNLSVMNADGSNPVNLTRSEHQDLSPAWASDSNHLYFMSFRNWPGQIFIIGSDGTGVTPVSSGAGQHSYPVPRPSVASATR